MASIQIAWDLGSMHWACVNHWYILSMYVACCVEALSGVASCPALGCVVCSIEYHITICTYSKRARLGVWAVSVDCLCCWPPRERSKVRVVGTMLGLPLPDLRRCHWGCGLHVAQPRVVGCQQTSNVATHQRASIVNLTNGRMQKP